MLSKPRRRWFSYSLRTFFCLLTLFGVWLGVQMKWVRDRRDFLEMHREAQVWRKPKPRTAAPAALRLFGKRGVYGFNITRLSPEELARAKELFPEAVLMRW